MGQSTPFRTNDGTDADACLTWAQIAGLIDIRPDGSWNLTIQGRASAFELLRTGYPFRDCTLQRDRQQAEQIVHLI